MHRNEIFYNEMYKEGRSPYVPTNILWNVFRKLRKYELHRTDAVVDILPIGYFILDIGCGSGNLLIKAKKKGYKKIYGIDVSKNVVKGAIGNIQSNHIGKNSFVIKQSDVDSKIPFSNNKFDAVTCVAVMEHIFDPYFVINEIKRVLKKDGVLIMEVPNIAWLPHRVGLLFGKLPVTAYESGWDGGHLHYFTYKATQEFLEENGFKVIYKGSSGIFHKIRNIYPELFGGNIIIKAIKK